MEAGVLQCDARGSELAPRPDDDAARPRVTLEHVERLGPAAQPASLADREVVLAVVMAEHLAAAVDDLARAAQARTAVALQERAPAEARDEAQVLALALVRDRQTRLAGERAHGVLREAAEREREPVEIRRVEAREHVALVLAGVGGAHQRALGVARDAGVVTGREPRGPSVSASSSIASKRTSPLQRTHGFGVRPAA